MAVPRSSRESGITGIRLSLSGVGRGIYNDVFLVSKSIVKRGIYNNVFLVSNSIRSIGDKKMSSFGCFTIVFIDFFIRVRVEKIIKDPYSLCVEMDLIDDRSIRKLVAREISETTPANR